VDIINAHRYRDSRLVVGVRSKCLLLFARYTRIAFHKFGHYATCCLDAEWQGSDIDQKYVLDCRTGIATENGSLDGSSVRHGLVRIDGQVKRFAAKEILPRNDVKVYININRLIIHIQITTYLTSNGRTVRRNNEIKNGENNYLWYNVPSLCILRITANTILLLKYKCW